MRLKVNFLRIFFLFCKYAKPPYIPNLEKYYTHRVKHDTVWGSLLFIRHKRQNYVILEVNFVRFLTRMPYSILLEESCISEIFFLVRFSF